MVTKAKKQNKKLAIFIIAYKAAKTLIMAVERIPESIKKKAEEIYVIDDSSDDNTYYVGVGYKHLHKMDKLKIYQNKTNQNYGGNQKKGYNYAIKKKHGIVVMLHGDVQYAPENIPALIKPIEDGKADMVFGSRIMGKPLQGGMPLWKYLGNRTLTFIENLVLGLNLSEYHSGFRAYSVDALKQIPFNECSNEYIFDTEILIQFRMKKFRIKEIPIQTHYGPESHTPSIYKSFQYAWHIFRTLAQYTLQKKGIKSYKKFDIQ